MANGHVPTGEYTYVVEGSETQTAILHWPAYASGVTIGKGYDMRHRSRIEIYSDMIASGVSKADAEIIATASGLNGSDAEQFVRDNKHKVSPLTKRQKVSLFHKIWPNYLANTIQLYEKVVPSEVKEHDIAPNARVESVWKKTEWENLDNKIQDIIIDIYYQGSWSKAIAKACSKNDANYLASYLENDPGQKPYKSRRRPDYLRGLYNPKGF